MIIPWLIHFYFIISAFGWESQKSVCILQYLREQFCGFLPAPFSDSKCDFSLQIKFLPYIMKEITEIYISWNFLLIPMIKAYNCN